MGLAFKFKGGERYLIDGRPMKFEEPWDAVLHGVGGADKNKYFFRCDRTREQVPYLEPEVKHLHFRNLIVRTEGKKSPARRPSDTRPSDLKPGEASCRALLLAYDLDPFLLTADGIAAFLKAQATSNPAVTTIPNDRLFRTWVRTRGTIGDRTEGDFRDKRGRHSKRKFPTRVQWALEMVVAWYYAAAHRTHAGAHARLNQFVETLVAWETKRGNDVSLLVCPDFSTVWRWIERHRTAERVEAKSSAKEAKTLRGVRTTLPALGKHLDIVGVDSTTCDAWIVFVPHLYILVRPAVTVVHDLYTGCVLAVVTTWREDIASVFYAIKASLMPKSSWTKNLKDGSALDAHGLGLVYLVDNALKQTGTSFQDALADVGSSVYWAAKGTPESKTGVERIIHDLNEQCIKKLPGGIPFGPTLMRKLGYDPRKDGQLILLDTLQERLNDWAIFHNLQRGSREYTPIVAWNLSVDAHGYDRFVDFKLLDSTFGQTKAVTVDRSGVKLFGRTFHDPDVVDRLLASMSGHDAPPDLQAKKSSRRAKGRAPRVRTKAKFTTADLSEIQIWDYRRNVYETLPCTLRMPKGVALDVALLDELKRFAEKTEIAYRTDEDVLHTRQAYQARMEGSNVVRKIEANTRMSKMASDMKHGPLPESKHVLKGIAETGHPHGRASEEVEIETLAGRRGDDAAPVKGKARGRHKPAARGKPALDAATVVGSRPAGKPPGRKKAAPVPKGANTKAKTGFADAGLDADTMLLLSMA